MTVVRSLELMGRLMICHGLTLVLFLHTQRAYSQEWNDISDAVIPIVEDLLEAKLLTDETHNSKYTFALSEKDTLIEGQKQVLEFYFNHRKKKRFKEINRRAIFQEIESFLAVKDFEKIAEAKDSTLITFRRKNNFCSFDYLEIYLANRFDHLIEVIAVYQDHRIPKGKNTLDEVSEISILLNKQVHTLKFNCEKGSCNSDRTPKMPFLEYTGSEINPPGTAKIKYPITKKISDWVLKENMDCDPDKQGSGPVMCYTKTPSEYTSKIIVLDTSKTKEYTLTDIDVSFMSYTYQNTVYVQTLCPEDINGEILQRIQKKLALLGFYHGALTEEINKDTLKAIALFQENRGILSDKLDFITVFELLKGIDH